MIQRYLPVWGYSKYKGLVKDVGIKYWWHELPLEYGHGLISPVHWGKPFKFPAECWIFGDSGGFSLRSVVRSRLDLGLDPVGVLQWQSGLCSVGCILDYPQLGDRKELRHWEDRLAISTAHSARALPEYLKLRARGHPFRWWGVLHGNTEAEQLEYYQAISGVYPFSGEGEGWAVRAEPVVNIFSVARTLRVLRGLGIKRAHFLAATGQEVTAVLFVLGPEAGLEFVSYDSAYAMKNGMNRRLLLPKKGDPLKWTTLGEDADTVSWQGALVEEKDSVRWSSAPKERIEEHARQYLAKECPCAACAWMRRRTQEVAKGAAAVTVAKFGGWWSSWCQFHNLRVQQQMLERQWEVARVEGRAFLPRMLGAEAAARVCRIFEGREPEPVIPPTGSSRSLLDFA